MPFTRPNLVFLSFLVFGLVNNVLYVIILSAAVDLVETTVPKATVLLADITPALILKICSPFFISSVKYPVRVVALVVLSMTGMIIISVSTSNRISVLFGICLASISSGMGEVSFLQLTHYFERKPSIGGFATGTGCAGIVGSFMYLFMTTVARVSVPTVLLLSSALPLGFLLSFYLMLPPFDFVEQGNYTSLEQVQDTRSPITRGDANSYFDVVTVKVNVRHTLAIMRPLIVPYMIPLGSIYLFEYLINQGIAPILLFDIQKLPSWLYNSYRDIYVVYGFLYQLGVFLSRSSVTWGIRVRALYLLSGLQFVNLLLCFSQATKDWPVSNIWLMNLVIFYEGLLGGLLYANTFMSVSEDTPDLIRERAIGCVGISDSFGILIAGLLSLKVETSLCHQQVERGLLWCKLKK